MAVHSNCWPFTLYLYYPWQYPLINYLDLNQHLSASVDTLAENPSLSLLFRHSTNTLSNDKCLPLGWSFLKSFKAFENWNLQSDGRKFVVRFLGLIWNRIWFPKTKTVSNVWPATSENLTDFFPLTWQLTWHDSTKKGLNLVKTVI